MISMPYSVSPLYAVIADVAAVGDFLPVMPRHVGVVFQNQTGRRRRQSAVDFDNELAFRKNVDLTLNLIASPRLHSGKTQQLHFDERIVVVHCQWPNVGLPFE